MEDVQSHAPTVPLNIDRVGVRELRLPLLVRDRARGSQQTVASVDLGVDLPSAVISAGSGRAGDDRLPLLQGHQP